MLIEERAYRKSTVLIFKKIFSLIESKIARQFQFAEKIHPTAELLADLYVFIIFDRRPLIFEPKFWPF